MEEMSGDPNCEDMQKKDQRLSFQVRSTIRLQHNMLDSRDTNADTNEN